MPPIPYLNRWLIITGLGQLVILANIMLTLRLSLVVPILNR